MSRPHLHRTTAAVATRDWVAPRVADVVGEAKDWAQPRIGLVVQRAEPVVEEVRARSTAARSALRGEVPGWAAAHLPADEPSRARSPWVRLLLVLTLLAAATAAAAAVKLLGRRSGEQWQPASGPLGQPAPSTPSSHPATTAAPVADPEGLADDDGGSPVVGVSDGFDVAVTEENGTTQESTDLLPGADGEGRGPA